RYGVLLSPERTALSRTFDRVEPVLASRLPIAASSSSNAAQAAATNSSWDVAACVDGGGGAACPPPTAMHRDRARATAPMDADLMADLRLVVRWVGPRLR